MKFYLLGKTLKHSISPFIHSKFYEMLKFNAEYENVELADQKEIEKFIEFFLSDDKSKGFNVTIPYKEVLMQFCDAHTSSSSFIDATNCVKKWQSRLISHNTDWIGFIKSLEMADYDMRGKTVLLLGAGGAAKSILYALKQLSVRKIYISNRTYDKIYNLLDNYKDFIDIQPVLWQNYDNILFDVIINTTPLGMSNFVDISPIDRIPSFVEFVYDTIYNPFKTKLIFEAEKMGIKYINGLYMLIYQAAESYKHWIDYEVPDDVIQNVYEYAKIYLEG